MVWARLHSELPFVLGQHPLPTRSTIEQIRLIRGGGAKNWYAIRG